MHHPCLFSRQTGTVDSVVYGPSTSNKIECWWRDLHHRLEQYFKSQLTTLLNVKFHLLVRDLKLHDHEYFFKCFRMSPENFEKLTSWCSPYLVKATTRMREPISPSERLCVTLRYLVTGDAQVTIGASYRMSPTTVGRIIKETCKVIWQVLHEKGFVSPPNTQKEWRNSRRICQCLRCLRWKACHYTSS